jgi:signal transduction histidine kinase/CheY-like chemotaxis protein
VPPTTPKPLRSLYWSLIGTAALAALLVVAVFWLSARSETDNFWVNHTLMVRNAISHVLNLAQHAETSQRGYLLTGRKDFLASFESADKNLPGALDGLAKVSADNPRLQQAIQKLRPLLGSEMRGLQAAVDAREQGRSDAATVLITASGGAGTMAEIRRVLSGMEAEENRLFTVRLSGAHEIRLWLQGAVAVAFLLICAVGALVSSVTRRSFAELASARDKLIATNTALMDQINQREAVESQLRQSQKMEAIGQLTGGIAHDFNNMLGVISGSLDLMKRRIKNGDFAIDRFMEAAQQATQRAAVLTHRLLAFSRRQPLEPKRLDANRMIAEMSDLLRSTLSEHVRIETVSAAGLWSIHADAHQLESALLNIAINARDAMPDGGKLTIETANAYLDDAYCKQHVEVEPGQYVMIAITDTGKGMTSDVVSRAFDPFFTTKPPGKGTGLGLSQVYGFIKQSHGHIKIYSEVGAGTTVKLYLPRLLGTTKETKVERPATVQRGSVEDVILVVEDDALVRRLTVASLNELGYTVLDSEDAADALSILRSRSDIALLFTDVVMPGMNGRKLADEALKLRPEIKVLYTTGYTPNAVVHGGVLDSGVNFLSKPFTVEQLAGKVRNVLDK